MLVKSEIYHSGRAKAPCILARTSRNSSSSCFVSSFLFSFSLPSKTGTATKIFDKKTRSRSSCNLRTWWNRRRRRRRQFSFVAVNDSLSKMRQGSETAERRETERLPVVASVYEFIVVLPRTKIWSYRERRGFVYPRVWVEIRGKEQRTCARGGERRRNLSRRIYYEVSSLLFFYHRCCGFCKAAGAAADVLWLLLLPQKSAMSCVVIVGTPFQTWAGKKLQQQQQLVLVKWWQLEWVLVSEMDHEIPMLWNNRKKAEITN